MPVMAGYDERLLAAAPAPTREETQVSSPSLTEVVPLSDLTCAFREATMSSCLTATRTCLAPFVASELYLIRPVLAPTPHFIRRRERRETMATTGPAPREEKGGAGDC